MTITSGGNASASSMPVVLPGAMPGVMTGLVLMTLAVLVSPLIDIFSKLATKAVPAAEITAARFLLQAALMAPFLMRRGGLGLSAFRTTWRMSGFHALRGGVLTLSMVCFVTTLAVMEVADAIAIFFVEPMILTILSSLFLKETVGWRRYTACFTGFLGAMLIIQPSFRDVGYVALLPVVTAFCIAVFALLTRLLAQRENPWSMQFHTGLWGLAFCAALMALAPALGFESARPVLPDAQNMGLLLGVGISAAVAGILSVYAYRAAPASTLAPLQYLEIVSATAFGWLVFGDFPDAMKWLGIAIIVASGLFIVWRERRFAGKPVSVQTVPPI